jgi:hypothetical protein
MSNREEFETQVDNLRAVRDQIRVDVHLAGMDLRDAWKRLEPRLRSVVDGAEKEIETFSIGALDELAKAATKLRDDVAASRKRARR